MAIWAPVGTDCWSLMDAPSMPIPVTQMLVGASGTKLADQAASSRISPETRAATARA